MKQGYFAFPRRLWVRLPTFSKNEKVILLWIHGAVAYTGPDRGVWKGSLWEIVDATGITKTSVHRALLRLHNEELQYTPARSRREKSKIKIIGFKTAKDYTPSK